MNNKKYDLVKNDCVYKYFDGKRMLLYRIRALKDFTCVDYSSGRVMLVKEGDRGGYIETEDSLSQAGTCWVHENSYVYGGSKVLDDAQILPGSDIMGGAVIKGYATIDKNMIVFQGEVYRKYKEQ